MIKQLKKIKIIGGGSSGLISALILKSRFNFLNIEIIKSDKIGIIGVGEGSTEHFIEFMNFCGINYKEFIKECDATLKIGILFKDWTKNSYFHNVISAYTKDTKVGQYYAGYAFNYSKNLPQFSTTDYNYLDNLIPNLDYSDTNGPAKSYHFNTFKFNEYLIKKCKQKNIKITDDIICDTILNEKGEIDHLVGEKSNYKSDFYIDCTGFKRVLMSKLKPKWVSYSKYLLMNEAIAFPTKDTDEYPPYTLSQAMKYGWMWRIPTQGRWGNGYVFNNNYINSDQAKKEVEDFLGYEIDIFKNIKFDPGCLDKIWINNCMTVGLSSSFLEPLEATSIGTTINQMFLFLNYIQNYNEKNILDFNKKIKLIIDNTRDFVLLHYVTDRQDTDFWKDIKNVKLPNSLINNLEKWKTKLPIEEDMENSQYLLFRQTNFLSVLYGMNYFDRNAIKNEYDSLSNNIKEHVHNQLQKSDDFLRQLRQNSMNHKEYLRQISIDNS